MNIDWTCKAFKHLSPGELYGILRLRSQVFVVEQQCVFLEMDNKDQHAHHLMGRDGDQLIAYTRLLDAGVYYHEAAIGRVVTAPASRNLGLGKTLMLRSIETLYHLFGKQPIRIGAQYHLKKFYESVGFTQAGDVYDEDGIDHIEMILPDHQP